MTEDGDWLTRRRVTLDDVAKYADVSAVLDGDDRGQDKRRLAGQGQLGSHLPRRRKTT
jgi:hypothetical protein